MQSLKFISFCLQLLVVAMRYQSVGFRGCVHFRPHQGACLIRSFKGAQFGRHASVTLASQIEPDGNGDHDAEIGGSPIILSRILSLHE